MIEPSVPSSSASVSILTLAARTTGRPNETAVSSTRMSPFSVIVPAVDVSVSVPPSVTAARVMSSAVIVRLFSFRVPPTAPWRSTSPVLASSVSDWVPAVAASIVEVKVMSPSVVSSFLSLSTVTLACRSTGPVKVILPLSLL